MDRLLEAYRAARYEVDTGDQRLVLRVDQPSAALARLHQRYAVNCSAFITACNPGSRICSPAENHRAGHALIRQVEQRNLAWLPAAGVDPAGRWPEEPGLLILGLGPSGALPLARQFGQAAIIVNTADATPRLIPAEAP